MGSKIEKEYIIINKTAIQKRIEELEKAQKENLLTEAIWAFAKQELKQILSQSTPLIPEIEKAFYAGFKTKQQGILIKRTEYAQQKQDYISNLKLDI
jgi:hypothetical protein